MTTKWRQRDPYDFFVPKDCPVGCVAVAVGQIMKFHKHPNNSNEPKFNWSIMPDIAWNINQQGAINIALLLKDIGEKVNMQYAPSSSGAYSIDARNALVNDYGYSGSANLADYNHRRVVNDIVSKRSPIYMDGFVEKKYTIGDGGSCGGTMNRMKYILMGMRGYAMDIKKSQKNNIV